MSAPEEPGDVPVWTLTIAEFKALIGQVVRHELERHAPRAGAAEDLSSIDEWLVRRRLEHLQ
jgi:hypothetical protein